MVNEAHTKEVAAGELVLGTSFGVYYGIPSQIMKAYHMFCFLRIAHYKSSPRNMVP